MCCVRVCVFVRVQDGVSAEVGAGSRVSVSQTRIESNGRYGARIAATTAAPAAPAAAGQIVLKENVIESSGAAGIQLQR